MTGDPYHYRAARVVGLALYLFVGGLWPNRVTSIGYLTRIGIGEEAVYGTPVLTTQVLPSMSESLNDVYAEIPDESLQGSPVYGTPEQGNFSGHGRHCPAHALCQ